jgi:hypothetical protein
VGLGLEASGAVFAQTSAEIVASGSAAVQSGEIVIAATSVAPLAPSVSDDVRDLVTCTERLLALRGTNLNSVVYDPMSPKDDFDIESVFRLLPEEAREMTPIPSGLPSIGPATLTLLRSSGISTAYDILNIDVTTVLSIHNKYLRMNEGEAETDKKALFIRALHKHGIGASDDDVQVLLHAGSKQGKVSRSVLSLARKLPSGDLIKIYSSYAEEYVNSRFISEVMGQSACESLQKEFLRGRTGVITDSETPNVNGVGPARWAVLVAWARDQAVDRSRTAAAILARSIHFEAAYHAHELIDQALQSIHVIEPYVSHDRIRELGGPWSDLKAIAKGMNANSLLYSSIPGHRRSESQQDLDVFVSSVSGRYRLSESSRRALIDIFSVRRLAELHDTSLSAIDLVRGKIHADILERKAAGKKAEQALTAQAHIRTAQAHIKLIVGLAGFGLIAWWAWPTSSNAPSTPPPAAPANTSLQGSPQSAPAPTLRWWQQSVTGELRLAQHAGCLRPGIAGRDANGHSTMTFHGDVEATVPMHARETKPWPRDGQRVEARWSDGRWYPGTLTGLDYNRGDCIEGLQVRWADGSSPSSIAPDRVRGR